MRSPRPAGGIRLDDGPVLRRARLMAGVVSAATVIAATLALVSLLPWTVFAGWVSAVLMCAIPTTIVVSDLARRGSPVGLSHLPQPWRGVLLALCTGMAATGVTVILAGTIGGGMSPPPPMLMQAIITSIPVTFWLVIVWGGWPFILIRSPTAAGIGMLVCGYVVNIVQFRIFFDYGSLRGTSGYRGLLDPHGMFDAWHATGFAVTAVAVMFLLLHLDLWPLTRIRSLRRQPQLGLAWTVVLAIGASLVFIAGTRSTGLPVPDFLVRVPIPFIFGSVLLLNTLGGSVFATIRQPFKGMVSALTAAAVGGLLTAAYHWLMPIVSGPLASGPPGYDAELWLADALLAVTFPLLAIHLDYFELWPFSRRASHHRRKGDPTNDAEGRHAAQGEAFAP